MTNCVSNYIMGQIKNDALVLNGRNIHDYNGKSVIVTILEKNWDESIAQKRILPDIESLVTTSERGQHAQEYVKELRSDDRL